jgi:outer membrane lipoprotein-sorting protein
MMRVKIVGPIVVAMMCSWVNGCRSDRKPEVSSGPSAQKPTADSSKSTSESSPISWDEVASGYERLADYVCLYEKIERAISKGEEQKIHLSFRKPFDVRMEWVDPQGSVTQTAVYRQGFNDGKVLARQNGVLGSLAGTLRLDPNESIALSDSQHPITEVGIGKIIDRLQHDATNPGIASHFGGEEVLDGKPAYKVEFTASGNEAVGGLVDARKALVWIDRELKLPVKLELFDAADVLLERHCFKDVRINQKLGDKNFTL